MALEIPLSQGLSAFIDEEDADLILPFKWYAQQIGELAYAVANNSGAIVQMHRVIMSPPPDRIVDHKNRNGLDNRRHNLRICSHAENLRNTKKRSSAVSSRFKGVSRSRNGGGWQAEIEQNGQRLFLGKFCSEIKAAEQYDRAARLMFGKFALTNKMLGLLDGTEDRVITNLARAREKKAWKAKMKLVGLSARIA